MINNGLTFVYVQCCLYIYYLSRALLLNWFLIMHKVFGGLGKRIWIARLATYFNYLKNKFIILGACGVSKSLSHKTSPTLKTKLILTMTLIIKKSLFPYPIFVLHSMFYVPRAVHESGLYLTRTQPENFKWINL